MENVFTKAGGRESGIISRRDLLEIPTSIYDKKCEEQYKIASAKLNAMLIQGRKENLREINYYYQADKLYDKTVDMLLNTLTDLGYKATDETNTGDKFFIKIDIL
jgi:hypothetical protein